ncbi:CDP-glycerol glycerophosphotransferase [Streptosporangium subroseum]|uniref:CDP-glycerol glycerophosphotransferase n=1 Tax=Streptosporangium subroseum TaxID=106412 RepID=A0A239JDI9_9ACTN|nr:glycosyltransferase family 2 protein [Streptosporangium subroseum]SNT03897.1 CDP-glycerol glycerophosphotransferase [Streptosporangium subroseum]
MKAPLLSVVVPFYNVVGYIEECLTSLAAQTLMDVEFILVDDGSMDGGDVTAKEFAARDSRFRVLRQDNQGPGPARNLGIRHATGLYLAFADGDDVVPETAYELLVGSLEETGSDIACGGVRRITPEGLVPSAMYAKLFRKPARRTHIETFPDLIRDRTVWNKVYRRSFWDEHRLEFPGGFYEDVPVAIAAHVLASSVDILNEVVYHWRLRDTGDASTTQRRMEVANVEERVASLRGVQRFLAERSPQLKREFDDMVVSWDLKFVKDALEEAVEEGTPNDLERLFDVVAPCIDALDPLMVAALPASRRLELYLLHQRMAPELREVRRFRREEEDARVLRRGSRPPRWYAAYPFFGDRSRGIPDHLYDVTQELILRVHTDRVRWSGGRLLVEGQASIKRLDERQSRIKVWIEGKGKSGKGKSRISLPARQDGARFVAEVEGVAPGRWSVHAEVSANGMRLSSLLGASPRQLPKGGRAGVRAALGRDGRLVVVVQSDL